MIKTKYGIDTLTANEFLSEISKIAEKHGVNYVHPFSCDVAYAELRMSQKAAIKRVTDAREEVVVLPRGKRLPFAIARVNWVRDCPAKISKEQRSYVLIHSDGYVIEECSNLRVSMALDGQL